MKKFLIAGLAVAAVAVFAQPSLANPPQKPAPVAHPVAHPPAKAPAFHSPQMGGQHSAFGGQHPANGFQGNRPGLAQQQHPGLRPVNRPGQFNAADHRAVDPRLGHNEQIRRDEQLHREQQVRRDEVRHEEVRDEHRDERERHDALVREERRDGRGRPGPQDQGGGGGGSADQSAPADSGAPADASSGNGVTDTLSKVQSVLDLFQGKGQGKGGDQGQ